MTESAIAQCPIVVRAVELFCKYWPAGHATKQYQEIVDRLTAAVSEAIAESDLLRAVAETVEALQMRDHRSQWVLFMSIGPKLMSAYERFRLQPPLSDWPRPDARRAKGRPRQHGNTAAKVSTADDTNNTETESCHGRS